ncbi:PKD domain-containing protein [Haloarchaeobius baliensis]|uniref:PKD domain-containing protein n=1 Tax=Haloarchaeobius baliensis TaxID=1670458 RepID=UPI003F884E7C
MSDCSSCPSWALVAGLVAAVVIGGGVLAQPVIANDGLGGLGNSFGGTDAATTLAPEAACEISQQYPEPGEPMSIYAFDSRNADSYRYDLDGDGSPDTPFTEDALYTTNYSEGTYQPVVYAYNATDETSDTATCPEFTVAPNTPPTPQLTYDPSNPVVGGTVQFDATASTDDDGEIYYLRWDFGADGSYEVNESVELGIDGRENRTYTTAGPKAVRITVEDDDGDSASTTVEFTVDAENTAPTASFDVSPQPAVAGDPARLDASASSDPDGSIAEYRWDWNGDGTVDETTNYAVVDHPYAYDSTGPGYAVTRLTVVDDDGQTGSTTRDVSIVESAPVADCTVSPSAVEPGGSVTIDASGSANAAEYQYDTGGGFGDYTTQSQRTVDYVEEGTYDVRVRVWGSNAERSDTADCGTVTVATDNVPPTASFTHSPAGPGVGETVTFDASGSSDPDGSIATYRWDWDADGTIDSNTVTPTTTHTFTSDGAHAVRLVVVDDDGATARAFGAVDVTREPGPVARCSVSAREVVVGEEVIISAERSERGDDYQFDTGTGEFGDYRAEPTRTTSYGEPGTYSPRVRVLAYPSERSSVVDCPTVDVTTENVPPTAAFAPSSFVVDAGDTVTFDASNATDADGRVVEYRWDFDGDGTTDAVTAGPTTDHTYDDTANISPMLEVVDDDGATDRISLPLDPAVPPGDEPGGDDDEGFLVPPWWVIPGAGVGAGGGYLLCRSRSTPAPPVGGGSPDGDIDIPAHIPGRSGGSKGGIDDFATGTFETPPGGGTVAVTDLDFEPDLVLFTATNNVGRTGDDTVRTDGWTYGTLSRADDGTLTQNVVGVANDARRTGSAVGSGRDGLVLDLLVHDDGSAGALAGSVTKTTSGGFEMSFDGSSLPAGSHDDSFTVMFRAFRTDSDARVETGHFLTPATAGVQSVQLGLDASFVSLTSVNAVHGIDTASATDGAIGVSHGEAVKTANDAVQQHVANSTLVPETVVRNAYGGYQDRALHLMHGRGDEFGAHTTGRVTKLGETMELTYDEVTDTGQGGHLVTYVAVEADDHRTPEIGQFRVPAPDADYPTRVDVGFDPAMVEFTTCNLDALGTDQVVADHAFGFGWSHGVAMPAADGSVSHHLLHGSLAADDVFGRVLPPVAPGAEGEGAATDGGVELGSRTEGQPSAARVLALGDDGTVTGRDDVVVSGVTNTGFEVETRSVSTGRRNTDSEVRPVVFYRAWPKRGEL